MIFKIKGVEVEAPQDVLKILNFLKVQGGEYQPLDLLRMMTNLGAEIDEARAPIRRRFPVEEREKFFAFSSKLQKVCFRFLTVK